MIHSCIPQSTAYLKVKKIVFLYFSFFQLSSLSRTETKIQDIPQRQKFKLPSSSRFWSFRACRLCRIIGFLILFPTYTRLWQWDCANAEWFKLRILGLRGIKIHKKKIQTPCLCLPLLGTADAFNGSVSILESGEIVPLTNNKTSSCLKAGEPGDGVGGAEQAGGVGRGEGAEQGGGRPHQELGRQQRPRGRQEHRALHPPPYTQIGTYRACKES